MITKLIAKTIERMTFRRVRFNWPMYSKPSLMWIYTPYKWTAYFGAGGWIYLSPYWLAEKYLCERKRRMRVAARTGAKP